GEAYSCADTGCIKHDRNFRARGEPLLCFFGLKAKILLSVLIKVTIKPGFRAELSSQIIHYLAIPVFAAKLMITIRTYYFDLARTDSHDSNIECATTHVIYENGLFFLLSRTAIEQCSCSGLADNLNDIQTSNVTGILCCRSLSGSEIRRAS